MKVVTVVTWVKLVTVDTLVTVMTISTIVRLIILWWQKCDEQKMWQGRRRKKQTIKKNSYDQISEKSILWWKMCVIQEINI